MSAFHSPEPWYLTIVRTQGIQFLRPEKSWRPIVTVTLDHHQTHETILGSDGQNPNLKSPFVLRDVDAEKTRLDICVYHKSHSKSRKKRHLVGSAYISVADVLRRQAKEGASLDIRLSCPPAQKRSSTVNHHCASLTIRLRAPPVPPSPSITAVNTPPLLDDVGSNGIVSDAAPASPITSIDEPPWHPQPALPPDTNAAPSTLRKRRKRPLRGFVVNTTDEEPEPNSSQYSSSCPPTPPDDSFTFIFASDADPKLSRIAEAEDTDSSTVDVVRACAATDGAEAGWFAPRVLPQYVDQISLHGSLSLAEAFVNKFAPYAELCEATQDGDFEKILGRLLTEWYVIGASLLALAGLNAAVFGFAPGGLFAVDGLAMRSVAIGSIAAGLGIVVDSWFMFVYSGANVVKFQKQALDVYNTYFFFCLTCRLPTLALLISSVALTLFILAVAWDAWPAAVLVMSFAAGVLVSLQYLVFGCHRAVNLGVWAVRAAGRGVARRIGGGWGGGGGVGGAGAGGRGETRVVAGAGESRVVEVREAVPAPVAAVEDR